MDEYNDKFPAFDSALTFVANKLLAKDSLMGSRCLSVGGFDGLFGILLARSVSIVHVSTDQVELERMAERLMGPSVEYLLCTNLGMSYSADSLRLGRSPEDLDRADGIDHMPLHLDLEREAELLAGEEFDHAVMIRALHHASDPAALVRIVQSLLTPGGSLYVIDFWADSLDGTIRKFFTDPDLLRRYVERVPSDVDELIEWLGGFREAEQNHLLRALGDVADACGRPAHGDPWGAVESGLSIMNDWVGDYHRCRMRDFNSLADVSSFWAGLAGGAARITLCDEGCQYVAEWTKHDC